MIEQVLWIYKVLKDNERMRIITSRTDWEVSCDKSDVVKEKDGAILIMRKNGNVAIVNAEHIIYVCTAKKGVYL